MLFSNSNLNEIPCNSFRVGKPPVAPEPPARHASFFGESKEFRKVVGEQLAVWLPQLAEFAKAPVSRVDLRAWLDDSGVPDACRPALAKHLHQVPLSVGVGVMFGGLKDE